MLHSEQPSLRGTDTELLLEKWDSPQRSVASPHEGEIQVLALCLVVLSLLDKQEDNRQVSAVGYRQQGPTGT